MRLGHPLLSTLLCIPLALTGCALQQTASPIATAGLALQGKVYGGQQPISGSHVYLLAANTTGYGGTGFPASPLNASISLLSNTGNSDAIGAYVLSDANGGFSITGDYSCTPNTQVYLYALGGDPGSGPNSAVGLLAALGNCPTSGSFLATIPSIQINEVTTIAAAYAFAGFATDATHVSSSGTPLAQTGIANAFANATNLADISTGAAVYGNSGYTLQSPTGRVNAFANILAACINTASSSSSACTTLLSNALSAGTSGTQPTDTASAAINIAHNPGANVATLFGLPTPTAPFGPAISMQPNDFSLAFTIIGTSTGSYGLAIDASGNAWATNQNTNTISEYSSLGVPISPFGGFTSPDMGHPNSLAIDAAGNIWVSNASASLSKFSPSGAVLSGQSGFVGGGLINPHGLAIDPYGNVWAANFGAMGAYTGHSVSKFSSSGIPLSPNQQTPYTDDGGFRTGTDSSYPYVLAIDVNGNVWVGDSGIQASEFNNAGTLISPVGGYPGLAAPVSNYSAPASSTTGVAITASGNVWFNVSDSFAEGSSTGSVLTSALTIPSLYTSRGLSADGAGNLWAASTFSPFSDDEPANLTAISSTGSTITPPTGLQAQLLQPTSVAVDGSGDVWVTDTQYNSITEFVGAATPVVTPVVANLLAPYTHPASMP